MPTTLNWQFAARTRHMKRSTIREILKLTQLPDVISFAGGLPAPATFPVERMRAIGQKLDAADMQYSPTEGLPALRDFIAERLSTAHLKVTRDNVLIVSGSQQALDLLGRVLIDDGARVVVENPTYLGMLMAWKPYGLDYLPVPTDDDGMQVAQLPPLLDQAPRLIYAVPNFQNPQGTTLPLDRRCELIRLIHAYGIPLIEDNAYGELRYSGEDIPSLLSLDAEARGNTDVDGGQVIYVGTFSKILAPGLRVGWIAAPEPVIEKAIQAKQSADLHTSTLNQVMAQALTEDDFLTGHVATIRDLYRVRRDVMLEAMRRYFPPQVTWTTPDGGLFLMARCPESIDTTDLLAKAVEQKVAFIPGADFHIGGVGRNTMRLNFSNAEPERITEGIRRLGALLAAELGC